MSIYVGGTTQTYELDFFTKVAGSTIECPLKIYGQDVDLANLPNPSTGWVENTTQSDLDMLKSQEGITLAKSTTTSGKARAMMVEVDLSGICTAMYGNSNSSMKSNYQTTSNIDLYAVGSGANSGATAYKCQSYAWNATTLQWELLGENTNSTIALTNRVLSKADYINSSNKMYILITSGYASDGTIASSISLDYLKIKLNFNRVADSIAPLSYTFANKWFILLKDLFFLNTNNPKPIKVGSLDIDLTAFISNRKMHNVLIYQDGVNIKYYVLASKGTLLSGTITSSLVQGMQNISFNTSDYFISSLNVLNNYNPADSNEALAVLNGTKAGFENAELLYSSDFSDASKWTLANNASISNKTLILSDWNSTGTQNVWVFPNNQYEIQMTKKDQMGVVEVLEYYTKNSSLNTDTGDILIRSQVLGAGVNKFTTSNYTNKIKVKVKNQLEGFQRNSIAYMSDGTQVANNVPRLEVVSGSDKAIMIEEGTTNLFPSAKALNFDSAWTSGTLNGTYTVKIWSGTGKLTLSGGATGEVMVGNSLTFTVSNSTVTFTPSGGTPQRCQLEQKTYPTSFTDGTRQPEIFKIPNNVLNANEGTIECIVEPISCHTYNYNKAVIFCTGVTSWKDGSRSDPNGLGLCANYSGKWRLNYGIGSTSIQCETSTTWANGTIAKLCIKYGSFGIKLFVNGILEASNSNIPNFIFEYFNLGSPPPLYYFYNYFNGLISDFHISSVARTDQDIQYRATNGFVVDQYTTYYLDFDKLGGAEFSKVSLKEKF